MYYEELLEKVRSLTLLQRKQSYEFRTLTVFQKENTVKISVRWKAGIDFSSDEVSSFKEAYISLLDKIDECEHLTILT